MMEQGNEDDRKESRMREGGDDDEWKRGWSKGAKMKKANKRIKASKASKASKGSNDDENVRLQQSSYLRLAFNSRSLWLHKNNKNIDSSNPFVICQNLALSV